MSTDDAQKSLEAWAHEATLDSKADYVNVHLERYRVLIGLLDALTLERSARVLEIGSGDGFFSAYLRDRYGWDVAGLDCLQREVELSRARGISTALCNVDTESIPHESGAFDLVIFDSVLEHLYQPSRAIAEVKRVIAVGGCLILGTPHATALVSRIRALAGQNPFARFNQFNAAEGGAFMRECAVFYTPEEARALLAPEFLVQAEAWSTLVDPYRARRPAWRNIITPLRLAICRAVPRLSDFFYLVARRVEG